MRTGRPKKPLEIADEEREKLRIIVLRPKSAQAMAMRVQIVLCCGQGMSNSEVARRLINGASFSRRHLVRPMKVRPTARTYRLGRRSLAGGRNHRLGSLLENRFYAERGIPAFAYGPGLLTVSHGPNEFVPIQRIAECAEIYALTGLGVRWMVTPRATLVVG